MDSNFNLKLFQNLFSNRNDEGNNIEIRRKIILIYIISIIGMMALVPLGVLAFVEGNSPLGYFDLSVAAVLITICICLKKTGYHSFYSYFGLFIVGGLFVYLFTTGGAHKTGHLWFYTFPLVTSFLLGSKKGAILTSILFAIALFAFVLQDYSAVITKYSKYFKLRFIFSFLVVSTLAYFYEKVREKAQLQLVLKNADLEKSEDRYRSLVENTLEGYFICEIPSGQFLFLNERACDIHKYSLEEGLKLTIWDVISSEDHNRVKHRIQARMEGKKLSSERNTYTSVRKDGSFLRSEISTSLVTFEGRPVVQGVIRDVTEQERLEWQLNQSKKMEAIGLLAAGVAHDLNNVLSGVVSYPDMLLMDLPEDSPLRKPIQTIHSSGQKAVEIVQDLLTLARRGVSNKSILNLNVVVSDYLKSPEHEKLISHHSNISVETILDKRILNIEGSSTQLIKMIMNLVSNAAEAQPTGGKITISTRNQYVDTPIQGYEEIKEGDYVVLEIMDTGFGIAEADLNRIFEPFYTKKVMGRSGSGLGMAVVWGTIHDHEGYIDIKSTEGVGTTFSLFFQVTLDNIIKKKEFIPVEEYMGQNETVLVIDDVQEQREIAATILGKLNYLVTTVSSGEDAVEYMKNNLADILILDMIMEPGIDGLETYRRIKMLHPDQKAIIASGYSETERVKSAQILGAGEYIKKPYTLEKIGIAVKNALEK